MFNPFIMSIKETELDTMNEIFDTEIFNKNLTKKNDIKILDALYSCCLEKRVSLNYKNYLCFKITYFMDIFKYLSILLNIFILLSFSVDLLDLINNICYSTVDFSVLWPLILFYLLMIIA